MSIQYSIANPVEPVSLVRAKGLVKRKEEREKKERNEGRRKEGKKGGRKGKEEGEKGKRTREEEGRVVQEGLLAERDLGSVLLLKYRVAVGNSIDDRV